MIKEINARNFKLERIDQELTGRDIFTGPNGCGKSARLQALQIAMFGFIPSVGKQANATMGYALDGKMEVELKSDSLTVSRTFRKKVSKRGAVSFTADLELLPLGVKDKEQKILEEFGLSTDLIDISNFIQMSASQRRNLIANLCASSVKQEETKLLISPSIQEGLWNDDLSDMDNINNIESFYKEKLASLRSSLKEKKGHLNELKSEERDLDGEKPEVIQKKIDDIEAKIDEYNKAVSASEANKSAHEAIQSQLASLNNRITELNNSIHDHPGDQKEVLKEKLSIQKQIEGKEQKIKDLKDKVKSLSVEKDKLLDKHSMLKAELVVAKDLNEKFSGSNCPFIGKECPEAKLLKDHIKESSSKIKNLTKTIAETESEGKRMKSDISTAERFISDLDGEIAGLNVSLGETEEEIKWLKNVLPEKEKELKDKMSKVTELNNKLSEMEVVDTKKSEEMIITLKQEKKSLIDKKDTASSQKSNRVEAEKVHLAIKDVEDEMSDINDILSLVGNDGIKGSIIRSTHQPLIEEMNKMLDPMGLKADVMLERDNKEVFDICLVRAGKSVRFDVLSEGQKTVLSSAFLCAVQELSGASTKVLLIEASELDDENFFLMTNALSHATEIDNILIARHQLSNKNTFADCWTFHNIKD